MTIDARPIEILMVEDNPGDVRLTQEALKEYKIRNNLQIVGDGEQAMKFLRQQEPFQGATRPDLILLDLNLPKMDGREVLQEIKNDPELKSIPIVVLTTSEAEEDIVQSYELHANSYVTKPVDFERFVKVVKVIEDFWFTVVKLPKN